MATSSQRFFRWTTLFILSGCAPQPGPSVASPVTQPVTSRADDGLSAQKTSTPALCQRPAPPRAHLPASAKPPGQLAAKEVPLFVSIGWDDNGHADGIDWALQLLANYKNPTGNGRAAVYDGTPARSTFYVSAKYGENPATTAAWRRAVESGHEIGNHTYSHTTSTETTLEEWNDEIVRYEAAVPSALNLACTDIVGFRTPFLAHNDATLQAVTQHHYLYDCSLEEGFQEDQDGTDFLWPYTLDQGSPGNTSLNAGEANRKVTSYPGVWEMPVYAFVVPPDSECKRYGVPKGLRSRLKKVDPDFDVKHGKITGFDYNLWYLYQTNAAETLAIWQYTFDLRKRGNRAPFLLGMHTDIYSESAAADNSEEAKTRATWQERRQAVEKLIAYMAKDSHVRFVPVIDTLRWVTAPERL